MKPATQDLIGWVLFWIGIALLLSTLLCLPGCGSAPSSKEAVAFSLDDRAKIDTITTSLQSIQQQIQTSIGTVQGNNVSYDLSPEQRKAITEERKLWACAVAFCIGMSIFFAAAKGLEAPWNLYAGALGSVVMLAAIAAVFFL